MKKLLKKVTPLLLLLTLVLGMSNSAYAETKDVTSDGINPETITEGLCALNKGADEIMTGRHYTEKIEIEKDMRTDEYVYPIGQNSTNATKRAYCYLERHFVVYQRRVGDPSYKRKLYDEYNTTWEGEWRKKIDGKYSKWFKDPSYPKKTQVSRERSPLLNILDIMGG